MAELLGYRSDEMLGLDLLTFAHRGFESEIEKALSLEGERIPGPKEIALRRKDGKVVRALLLASPVFDGQGQYAGAVSTLCDLTSQKQREDMLRGRVAELEQKLHPRAGTDRVDGPGAVAAPRGTKTAAELVRGAVVLGACATFVATVAVLTGWGIVSALVQRGAKRDRPED